MRNILAALTFIFCLQWSFSESTDLHLVYTKTFGLGPLDITYQNDYRGTSPYTFNSIDGNWMWFAQSRNAFVVDRQTGYIDRSITYSLNKSGGYETDFVFGNGWAVGNRGNPVVLVLSDSGDTVSDFKYYYDENDSYPLMVSNTYIIRDYAFFFLKDRSLMCIPKNSAPLSTEETVKLLLDWNKTQQEKNTDLKTRHEQLIQTGNFLIVDGVLFPATDQNFRDYLSRMGYDSSVIRFRDHGGSPILGMSLLGEVVIRKGDSAVVFNQEGATLGTISLAPVMTMDANQERILDVSVMPNGDVYVMNAVAGDQIYFYRAQRNWGIDFVELARKGISDANTYSQQISKLNNIELRVLRNTFFALQGYDFQSWDLRSYFNGYDWYEPKPGVKVEPTTLNPDQKRLFDLVVAEEAWRK